MQAVVEHLHVLVQWSFAFLQLQHLVLHPVVQPHVIISRQVSGIGASDVSFGTSLPLSFTQPMVSGAGSLASCRWLASKPSTGSGPSVYGNTRRGDQG